MDATPENIADAEADSDRPRRLRWKPLLGIWIIWAILVPLFWFVIAADRTYQLMMMTGVNAAVVFFTLVWWTFFSGLRALTKLTGLAAAAAFAGLFAASFRLEFYGDMLPRLTGRWTQSPEDRAEEYFASAASARSTEGDAAKQNDDPLAAAAGDWPRFRGPHGDGIVTGAAIRRNWIAEPPRQVWRHPVGRGWSSFAIVGNRAYTQEQRRIGESVVCYDAATGKQIWVHSHEEVRFSESMGGVGPRATPTVFDSKVYALGATGILTCQDALSGDVVWRTNILKDAGAKNLNWAMSGSPLVYDDVVVVNPGGEKGRGLTAYDRLTGKTRWAAGDDPASYSAPRLETIAGVRQILLFDAYGLKGHDANNGKELWRRNWDNGPKVNSAQPIVRDGKLVFISSGYGRGSMLLEIENADGGWTPNDRWGRENRNMKMKFSDGVDKDGYVYGFSETTLTCMEYETGKVAWRERTDYGYGQMLLVNDLLLIQGELGEAALVEAAPRGFRELSRFQAIEGKTWNHPVLHRGFLYVRNAEEAACYDLRPATRVAPGVLNGG